MARFNQKVTTPRASARGPIESGNIRVKPEDGTGSPKFGRSVKGDLFLLAVSNMVGQDTFYESADKRDDRFATLVRQVAVEDVDWLIRFAKYLRTEMFMRTASIVLAAEAVHERLRRGIHGDNRRLVSSVINRLDEPGELLGYWFAHFGRKIPPAVKRGISDAMQGLVNEYSAMKYDGTAKEIRLGDVVEIVHPVPATPMQSAIHEYLLTRRHRAANDFVIRADVLPQIAFRQFLESTPEGERRAILRANKNLLANAAATWEWLSGWLPGGMDAEAWESVIPSMGHMALLRNLRNFDDARISYQTLETVARRISSPDEVNRGMQFPFRYYSAFRHAGDHWWPALSTALDLSTGNIPEFPGRTLILTDTSGSMASPISAKSTMTALEAAAVFAAAVARRNAGRVDLVQWATTAEAVDFPVGTSVLTLVEHMMRGCGSVGHSTNLDAGLKFFNGHDRVIVFSDMQVNGTRVQWPNTRVYLWNLMGYGASLSNGSKMEVGGMSDAAFRMISMAEAHGRTEWPF